MSLSATARAWQLAGELPPGPWAERRRLASSVRELIRCCVRAEAPEGVLREALALVDRAVARLQAYPQLTYAEAMRRRGQGFDPRVFADRSALIGRSNPLAPPVTLSLRGDAVIGTVTFTAAYEGAPGWVHGGLVAAAFDQVLGYLQVQRDVPSVTGSLTVRYLRPTPLDAELEIEARAVRDEGRQSHLRARMRQDGTLVAEAEAVFVRIEAEKLWPEAKEP